MLSLDQQIFLVQVWYGTRSVVTVQRMFRRSYPGVHGKNLPSRRVISRLIKKMEQFGTLHDRRFNTVRSKKCLITPEEVTSVRSLYRNRQRLSIGAAARRVGISKYRVRTILKKYLKKRSQEPF